MTAPIWPFAPRSGFRGALSFWSEAMSAFSAEQRVSRRLVPRLDLDIDCELQSAQLGAARGIARDILTADGIARLPDWRYPLRLDVASGSTQIDVGALGGLYAVGGEVIVWVSPSDFEVRGVTGIASGVLTLSSATTATLSGALVMPLRSGVLTESVVFDHVGFEFTRARLGATIVDYADLSVSSFDTLAGVEVLAGERLRAGSPRDTVLRARTYIDNGSGPIEVDFDRDLLSGSITFSQEPEGLEATLSVEAFFHRRRGRVVPFYLPTGSVDAKISASSSNSVTVPLADAESFYEAIGVLVRMSDSSTELREVTAAVIDLGAETAELVVSPDLPAGTPVSISEVAKCRLDSDQIEFAFDGLGGATVSTVARRLDYEL